MANLDLTKYGITGATEIVHNPSYEALFEAEMDPALEGFEKGQLTELGAVNVMTGIYTGRSPKDKFIVLDETSKDTVWWTSPEFPNDNKPAKEEILNVWKNFAGRPQELELPSAPKQFLHYFEEDNMPQTKLQRNLENGMAVSIGRLREDTQ